MFITTKYSGYNRHGEQTAAGRFLILLQPETGSTKYPHYSDVCHVCGIQKDNHPTDLGPDFVPDCDEHGIVARIRKLGELKNSGATDAYEAFKAEMDTLMKEKHDRHVDGCPKCDAYKVYRAVCRAFRPTASKTPLHAIVRYVRMRQCGAWMMGSAMVGKHRLGLSGSYGSDGLPKSVPDEVYEAGVELPQELYDAWNKGGGWNGAGSEATAMRAWALATFPRTKADVLRRLRAR